MSNHEIRYLTLRFACIFVVHGRDCLEILHEGHTDNGVYSISPDGNNAFSVFCDQKTNGGGWTVFQRRLNGSVDFYLNWTDYKNGFGDLSSEFWLGNDNIHRITSNSSQILIELKDHANNTAHASYQSFQVGSEDENYVLHFAEYSGTAGNSLSGQHDGMMFSTKNRDNDFSNGTCAQFCKGAWWYKNCQWSNLNGLYTENGPAGVTWYHWKGNYTPLKESEMKLKPHRGKLVE